MAMSPNPLSMLVMFSTNTWAHVLKAKPKPIALPLTVTLRMVLMSGPVSPLRSMHDRFES